MVIKLNIDSQGYTAKPSNYVGAIRNRLCSAASIRDVTPEQLIEAVQQGRSFTPAVMTGTKADTWQQQQVICADIDNDTGRKDAQGNKIMLELPLEPQQALRVMRKHGIDPYFMYYSFSNTEDWPKYRIVLILDEPITDPQAANEAIARFTGIFNKAIPHCADTTASDNARLYYGGRADCVIYRGGKTTSVSLLQALPVYTQPTEAAEAPKQPQREAQAPTADKTPAARVKAAEKPHTALQERFEYDKNHFDLAEYISRTESSRPVKKGSKLFFNPCPICGHNDDFQVTGALYHCHSASPEGGTGGTIIDYLMHRHKIDLGTACDKFKFEIMGYDKAEWRAAYIQENYGTGKPAAPAAQKKPQAAGVEEDVKDFTAYYRNCKNNVIGEHYPEWERFLDEHGLSSETAAAYWIGYDQTINRVILPINTAHYIEKDPTGQQPDNTVLFGRSEVFNGKIMNAEGIQGIFVTESVIDALSIIEVGGSAVALTDPEAAETLLLNVEGQKPAAAFIVCSGNDSGAAAIAWNGLRRLNIPCISFDVRGNRDNINAALLAGRQALENTIEQAVNLALNRPDNVQYYIEHLMGEEIAKFKSDTKTGYANLDEKAGGLYTGLYVLAAISSLGKTTFAHQMADQIAAGGADVLFFSMEQSRLEMVSKSIARRTAQNDIMNAVTSLSIRKGYLPERVKRAAAEYAQNVQDRISIIEGNFSCDVTFIGNYIRQYMQRNASSKPVVFVDYLQILQPSENDRNRRQTVRETVDNTITELKRISRELDIAIIVISSVNRSNYLTPIDFESLKESGGIEYSADVIWGLQLQCLKEPIFDKQNNIKERRERIKEEKAATPRRIELVCLKNRYGIASYSCYFNYYPAVDLFVESIAETDTQSARQKKAGRKL